MTIPELIAILKAAEAGKVIETKDPKNRHSHWVDIPHPDIRWLAMFLNAGHSLRVKPEPREWWATLYAQSGLQGGLWTTKEKAVAYNPEREVIRVREVIN